MAVIDFYDLSATKIETATASPTGGDWLVKHAFTGFQLKEYEMTPQLKETYGLKYQFYDP